MKNPGWKNIENVKYYDVLGSNGLKNYAIKGGMETCPDIKLIWQDIKKSRSLLDVGAGYGRVEKYLLEQKYSGDITAIESSDSLFQELSKYPITSIKSDIFQWQTNKKYDLILCVFSVITDFNQQEQLALIQKLKALLNHNGILYFESLDPNVQPLNTSKLDNLEYSVQLNDVTARGCFPTEDFLKNNAKQLSLNFKSMPYTSDTGRPRILYKLTSTLKI